MIFRGSRERALAVPKKLALEQIFGNGGTVEREEGHAGALRIVVNGLCNDLFTTTRFTCYQHIHVERSDLFDCSEYRQHGRRREYHTC